MINVCPNKLMQYANRECNAIMTIAKCTNTAASSNHHSSTPAAWFASGTAYHGRRYQNLRSLKYWRSYTIVGSIACSDCGGHIYQCAIFGACFQKCTNIVLSHWTIRRSFRWFMFIFYILSDPAVISTE